MMKVDVLHPVDIMKSLAQGEVCRLPVVLESVNINPHFWKVNSKQQEQFSKAKSKYRPVVPS